MNQILIIDDEERIRRIIKIQLRNTGFSVFEAEDSETAFTILKSQNINVVICDIKMKGLGGIEILKRIKMENETIPVIMLTGFIDDEYVKLSRENSCFDFLTKPVQREMLIQVINSALESRK